MARFQYRCGPSFSGMLICAISLLGTTRDASAQSGVALGGGQPVIGTHIYLYTPGTTGTGSAPLSLLQGSGVTIDAAGNGYVSTDSGGNFGFNAPSNCPLSTSPVYLIAAGGNSGYGGNNAALMLMSALPVTCGQLATTSTVSISEQTTIAAAFALAPFANVSSDGFGSSPAAQGTLVDAFAYANTLVSGLTGAVATAAPYEKINALADIITECVNTDDTSPCSSLFSDTTLSNGVVPSDTLQAALNIALAPTNNVSTLYNLLLSASLDPYEPLISAQPPDWSLTPTINWTQPSSITYGTALSSTQLNATAGVPGTYAYTPSAGTFLQSGNQTLSVTFTPTDATAYGVASTSTSLVVNQATPVITWPTPAPLTYPEPFSVIQENATANVPGTFSYSPKAGYLEDAGTGKGITATFVPTDRNNYTSVGAVVYVTINKGTPTYTWNPLSVPYGTPLGPDQLNATASVPGTFTYFETPGEITNAGLHILNGKFVPTSSDYSELTAISGRWTITQAAPIITWNTPTSIPYGTPLSPTQLNATSSTTGTFTYLPNTGTVLGVGSQSISANFRPSETTDYTSASASVVLQVTQATPAISWSAPSAIIYGTALSSAQLNASSTVPGIFTYVPAPGTVLSTGTQTLSVTFVPSDNVDYTTQSLSVPLTVNKPTPSISWSSPTPIVYGTPLSATQLDATAITTPNGVSEPGTFFYSPSAGTVLPVGNQTLQVTFIPTDTTNFAPTSASVILTVNQSTPIISISDIPTTARNGGSFLVTYAYSGTDSPTETVVSSTPSVCTVSHNTINYVGVGTCTLQANATATTDYMAATGSPQSFAVAAKSSLPAAGVISTFANSGIGGYTVDGGGPRAVATDSNGNVYVIDYYDLDDSLYCRILKVSAATGNVSTVAGSGLAGYSGDGGPATGAQIQASTIAVDGQGNIYINAYNHIRMVNASTGIISTVAGNGPISPSGAGPYGPTGDGGTYSGDGGPAVSAGLNGPIGFAVDSANNLYFVDSYNARIRKITVSTGLISTIAGNGTEGYSGDGGLATSAELNEPRGLAVDRGGSVYIADEIDQRIRKVSFLRGIGSITTVAGNGATGYPGEGDGGAATSAPINLVDAVAVDNAGNLYIADNETVRMVSAANGVISTIAGNGVQGYTGDGGPATSAELDNPQGVVLDNAGNIYIADFGNNVIRVVGAFLPAANLSISCTPVAITYGAQTTCVAMATNLSPPDVADIPPTGTVTFTYNGNPWVSCMLNNGSCSVTGLSGVGGGFYTITGSYSGDSNNAAAIASTSLTIYEATVNTGQTTPIISIGDIPAGGKRGGGFTVTYSYSGDGLPSVSSSTLAVCTVSGNTVSYVGAGRCTLQASATATSDCASATGSMQSFIVNSTDIALPTPGYIDTIAGNGIQGYSGDGGPATGAELYYPNGVATDGAGNIYFADADNNRVRMVAASTGVISTVAGNGTANYPAIYSTSGGDGGPAVNAEFSGIFGIAADSAGNIYLADRDNNRVRKVSVSTGLITTIAGNGDEGYSGDGGPAVNAELSEPNGVAVDGAGNIYIADFVNNRIRKVTASTGVITTVAGNGLGGYGGNSGYTGDGGPATSAQINAYGVAVDEVGDIYIPNYFGPVREVNVSTGIITTVAGKGTGNGAAGYSGDGGPATNAALSSLGAVTVDNAGNLYIADTNNNVVRMVTATTGIISTIAGNGSAGYSGDGGPAAVATLSRPTGIAVDGGGNLYIADAGNNVIRLRAAGSVPPAASVSIACTPSAIVHGSPTTCTAAVTGSAPTGTVTFTYNASSWTTCTLSSATCSVSGLNSLGGGLYTISGTYSGDGSNSAGSGTTTLTVSPATPTISIVSSDNPSTYGSPVTFTAAVTDGDTNPVAFYSGGALLGAATPSNGTATLTTSSLAVGSDYITASIAADGNYDAATFSPLMQTVNAAGQPDTGTVVLQVNGSIVAQTTYGANSTPASVAKSIEAGASSSLVKVSAVDNNLYIEALENGAGNSYPYALLISDTAGLSTPSFSASPSAGNLQGVTAGGAGSGQTLYSYCVSGPSNNCSSSNSGYDSVGNLLGYTDSVMGTWNFGYDSLNRLISGTPATGNSSNGGLSLCWSYDSFGNRTAQSPENGACPALPALPVATATYNSNNQVTWTSVRAAALGLSYDAAGNVTNDNLNVYLHDGEGRICAVLSAPAPGLRFMTGYLYDADGTRVAKGTITSLSCDPAVNGFQTSSDYVLDPSGAQVTEVGVNANGSLTHQHTNAWADGKLLGSYDDDGLHFYLDDPLGTRRVQTDYAGVIEQQCVSFPFGDGETCTPSPTEHLFTGKERDTESGLDYFGARYYASSMGRFSSPDDGSDQDPSDPQSWNLYSYVQNNPVRNTDPDGHDCVTQTRTSSTTEDVSVQTGGCSGDAGNGTTKTYVAGTVTGVQLGADGHSIDVGYTPYSDSSATNVTNLNSAPTPDYPGIAVGYNKTGFAQLNGAANLVNRYGGAMFNAETFFMGGLLGDTMPETGALSGTGQAAVKINWAHNLLNPRAGHLPPPGSKDVIQGAVEGAIKAGQYSTDGNGVIHGTVQILGKACGFDGKMVNGIVRISTVYGKF